MIDYKEHAGLTWAETIEFLEKKNCNVAGEILHILKHLNSANNTYYINALFGGVPSVRKYKDDIEKYLLLI
jgi:hypothetical protein